MASNSNNPSNSPMHLGLTGQFWPVFDDINQMVGEAGSEQHPGVETAGYAHHVGSHRASAASNHPAATQVVAANIVEAALSAAVNHASAEVVGEEAKTQARSERKRCREKQRRCDVNKQFADLTQLVQKIDAEDINEEDVANGTTRSRMTFNPANRVDLIASAIVLLERLHEAGKRRKLEIGSLQQQLEEAKKAGEDTAAKLKEAMLASPDQPMNKQSMIMVPMMMSSDGTGTPSAVPMMNPFRQHAGMPQAFGPISPQAMAPVFIAAPQSAAMPNPQTQAPGQAPGAAAVAPNLQVAATPMMMAPQPVAAPHPQHHHHQQPQQQQQQQQQPGQPTPHQVPPTAFQYMMPPMAGGGFMMPFHAPMAGQQMPAMGVQRRTSQESQTGHQEQKDSDAGGESNLAHCA